MNYTIFEYNEALNDSKLRFQNIYKFYLNPDEAEEEKKLKRRIKTLENYEKETNNIKKVEAMPSVPLQRYNLANERQ